VDGYSARDAPRHSCLIFTNNIQVAFFAFAGRVLFGLGTVYVLVTNGVLLERAWGGSSSHRTAAGSVHLAARLRS
jgi:hypothetical protein